jgi:hypothetical protein
MEARGSLQVLFGTENGDSDCGPSLSMVTCLQYSPANVFSWRSEQIARFRKPEPNKTYAALIAASFSGEIYIETKTSGTTICRHAYRY